MSAAVFVLAINVFVAGLFTIAFGALARRMRQATGAIWLSVAYGLGILNGILEFLLPLQAEPGPLNLLLFAVALCAFLACVVGLARHYEVAIPAPAIVLLGLGSVFANALVMDQASSASLGRAMIYQLPFFGAHLLGAMVVFQHKRPDALDRLLLGFLLVSGLQFLLKPILATALGGGGVDAYLDSQYGAYSQALTAFLLIANGVLMLLVIMRDSMAELHARSETDLLSGLLNRRGFEQRMVEALSGSGRQWTGGAMILADLDQFKSINDRYGHETGDSVIAGFGSFLQRAAAADAIVSRLGGEEFALFLPGANGAAARLFAEGIRTGFAAEPAANLPFGRTVTASFGVAEGGVGDTVSDMLRRADRALYDAKRGGRNRVCMASVDQVTSLPARAAAREDRRA